jgi:TRAP-type mannitol/chloroaromatic compound transport system substrate-binding protein
MFSPQLGHNPPMSDDDKGGDDKAHGRRVFLTGALAGAAAGITGATAAGVFRGGAAGAGPAVHRGQRVRWRLVSSFPASLDTIYGAAEVLSERVAAMTDGGFEIVVHQPGELVGALQVLDAVQKGSAEVGQTASYYYTGKDPALAFDATVPFGLTPRQQSAWLLQAGGLELMRERFAAFGIINFPAGNTGTQMGGWFKPRVDSLADLRGLRMRIPGLGGEVMDSLGVSVQVIGGGEIYPALERGAIDATEWVGPYDDEKLGFYQIAKNYYYPGWWEPGPSLSMLVHRRAWDQLPAVYREVFQTACREAAETMQSRYDAKNPPALKRLIAAGVSVRPFTDDIMTAAAEASEALLDRLAGGDRGYAKILDHWRAFRAESIGWFSTAELAYASFAWRR